MSAPGHKFFNRMRIRPISAALHRDHRSIRKIQKAMRHTEWQTLSPFCLAAIRQVVNEPHVPKRDFYPGQTKAAVGRFSSVAVRPKLAIAAGTATDPPNYGPLVTRLASMDIELLLERRNQAPKTKLRLSDSSRPPLISQFYRNSAWQRKSRK
jgi:hypothetical protein